MKLTTLALFVPFWFTQTSAQGFFPLHIGDRWEYWDCPQTFYDYSLRAIGDTILPNGYTYIIVQSDVQSSVGYYRQVGSRVHLASPFEPAELLRFDFSKTTGDTVGVNHYQGDSTVVVVVYDRIRSVFGTMRRQWGFWEQSLTSSAYVLQEVTDSLGITYITFEAGPYDDCLRGAIIDGIQYGIITSVEPPFFSHPSDYQLLQNYPNPFNPTTTIEYVVAQRALVRLRIFDLVGREVGTLAEAVHEPGRYTVRFDGTGLSSGVYLCRIETGRGAQTRRMILLK